MTSSVAAQRLRAHCTRALATFVSQSPPEAFLYRGHAQLELGRPYLALADYEQAARALNVERRFYDAAHAANDALPEQLTGEFPAVDAHLHVLVAPFLHRNAAVRTGTSLGRGVFAEKGPIERGEAAVRAAVPWMQVPLVEGLCSGCAKPLGQRVVPCGNDACHEEYCSRDCRAKALTRYHGAVCRNKQFQALELDLYQQHKHLVATARRTESNVVAGYLLLARVFSASSTARTVPSALMEMRSLTGRLTFSPTALVATGGAMPLYLRISAALGIATSVSFEEFLGVAARIRANAFTSDTTLSLRVERSMINHSCDSNLAQSASGEGGAAGSAFAVDVPEFNTALVAKRAIAAGEELTLNYFPHLTSLPFERRAEELRRNDFECRCAKCVAKI